MTGTANISPCGKYRYRLTRTWAPGTPAIYICLNPSTADAKTDDPTIKKCIGFAKQWGCGGIVVVNLFAYRTSKPKELLRVPLGEVVGPENQFYLISAIRSGAPVVAAWGANADYSQLAVQRGKVAGLLYDMRRAQGIEVKCFGKTKGGHPQHPLYLSYSTELEDFWL